MYFPLSDVTVSPLLLISIGFLVGTLGGFFGVGGGFLVGPLMLLLEIPGHFVVGTSLAHITGNALVATRRHQSLGHVDLKLGGLMVVGTMVGVEGGAWIIEYLKRQAPGTLEVVLSTIYLILLLSIGTLVFLEGFRATHLQVRQRIEAGDVLTLTALSQRTQRLHLPPMVSLPASGIPAISLWAVLAVGVATGFLTGLLGVGGGFIRVPALIYVLGVPTHVAVGTDLFEIVFSAGYGTLTHALKGNVDILMALVMQVGAATGAYLGALATRYISGPRLRIAFAFLPFIGAALLLMRLFRGGFVQ
ncbi:MAG: sulfite exporter TauE/SafE family protein [Chloroflexi bacterium]|nr:MAG: sulfite exporter TauE/SafE family protein [Chloroflexota bacterium]